MDFWKLNHRAFIEVFGSFKFFSPKVNKFTLLLREKLQSIFDDIFFSSEDRERKREKGKRERTASCTSQLSKNFKVKPREEYLQLLMLELQISGKTP